MDESGERPQPTGEILVECQSCGRRYAGSELAGTACLACGDELAVVAPGAPGPRPDEPIVEVYRAPDMAQAEVLRMYLESEGIRTAFRTAVPWGVLSFTVDGLAAVGILALESDAERARKLIEDWLEQDSDDDADQEEEE